MRGAGRKLSQLPSGVTTNSCGREALESVAAHQFGRLRLPTGNYKTVAPVADAILPFVDDDFATLIGGQLGLF